MGAFPTQLPLSCLLRTDALVVCEVIEVKVFQLNHSDISGGAARAAYRIHRSLLSSGIVSQMMVNVASSGDWTVQGPTTQWDKAIVRIRPQLVKPLCQLLRVGNQIDYSPALVPSRFPERLNASDADLVHLHWVQEEMLSIADIARIHKPIVWTLHDMWPICGAEHYTPDFRWRDGYRVDNRPINASRFDFNRYIWKRKRKYWRQPLEIVCPSQWLADCVSSSVLMCDWPVTVVPNPIDTLTWQPIDQRVARQLLGLPQEIPLLLFAANGWGNQHRKGIDLLLVALSELSKEPSLGNLQIVMLGQLTPQSPLKVGFPVHYVGHLHDDLSLCATYSAADVFVIPSRQDNLPNTGLEAHACGTPVVAFNVGGLPDIVDDRVTGVLAEPFEPSSLVAAIRWVLEDLTRCRALGFAARERAERLWSPSRVAGMYQQLYCRAIQRAR